MSEHLKAFLREWLEWTEGGAPDKQPFKRRYGLCSNFDDWLHGRCSDDKRDEEWCDLIDLFKADGLDKEYPFGGYDIYFDELEREEHYLNPARLAWVRSKVEQFAAHSVEPLMHASGMDFETFQRMSEH